MNHRNILTTYAVSRYCLEIRSTGLQNRFFTTKSRPTRAMIKIAARIPIAAIAPTFCIFSSFTATQLHKKSGTVHTQEKWYGTHVYTQESGTVLCRQIIIKQIPREFAWESLHAQILACKLFSQGTFVSINFKFWR